jgi:8-oxo-dGTP pyrophosphatase MutT (NUDIX family)
MAVYNSRATMTVPLRPASTVVLLREKGAAIEAFLVRRHQKATFLGGAHVFPGGGVDEVDCAGDSLEWCAGVAAAIERMPSLPAPLAVGHHVAALRELFEEAGVLLAYDGDALLGDRRAAPELGADRRALHEGRATLARIVRGRGWRLALDALTPLSHWVTPEFEPKRFDTRFFIAAMPPGQTPAHDTSETVESAWMTPADALARAGDRSIYLPPPTWTTLRALAPARSIADARSIAARAHIVPILPRHMRESDREMLIMPGDPLFPAAPGERLDSETRFVLDAGQWRAFQR